MDWFSSLFFGTAIAVPKEYVQHKDQIEVLERYEIQLDHPGLSEQDLLAKHFLLNKILLKGKREPLYSIDVKSVICADSLCKLVPVSLYWDDFGQYSHYALAPSILLEKGQGDDFEREDYRKLDKVLADENSPFERLRYHDITDTNSHGEVDGLTGATTYIMDEADTVVGATWTCFTLWHWVHGDAVDAVRATSAAELRLEEIIQLIQSNNADKTSYAINDLARRATYPAALAEAIESKLNQLNRRDTESLKRYLMAASDKDFWPLLKRLLQQSSKEQKAILINALDSRETLPTNQWLLAELDTLQLVDTYLQWLASTAQNTDAIYEELLLLLDREIAIARRAYWYLEGENLSAKGKQRLKAFEKKHKDWL